MKDAEEISALADKVQKSLEDFKRVAKILSLKAFRPFTAAEIGLENILDVSEGTARYLLRSARFPIAWNDSHFSHFTLIFTYPALFSVFLSLYIIFNHYII